MKRHLRLFETQHKEAQKQIDGQYSTPKKDQYELPPAYFNNGLRYLPV